MRQSANPPIMLLLMRVCQEGEECTKMAKHDEWTPLSWHCANCGTIVVGYRNAQGAIKVQCNRCRVVMVRKIKVEGIAQ